MNSGEHLNQFVVHLCALRRSLDFAELGTPVNIAFAEFHQIKHRADNLAIFTEVVGLSHRHIAIRERLNHTVFSVHSMG